MFNKIPIVSTNVGAIRDVLTHKENCYKTKKKSPEDIVNGINFMMNTNSSEMAEKAYSICKKEFSIKNMWENYRELFVS
jgi:glycosyltransferase involved in cell wall biosynthesis